MSSPDSERAKALPGRVAVVGATGTAGRRVAAELRRRGAAVAALSRATGVDVISGAGLDAALDGSSAVIDASSMTRPPHGMTMLHATEAAAANLTDAARRAGIGQLVVLSIVGIDDECFGPGSYYETKRTQERSFVASGIPTRIIRTTQWFEFALNPGGSRVGEDRVEVFDRLMQPVAVDSVAALLADAASSARFEQGVTNVAGPEQMLLSTMTEAVLRHVGDHRPVTALAPPVAELLHGALLPPEGTMVVGPTLGEWLGRLRSLDQLR